MIYKVLYQDLPDEVPTRERTSSLYLEAESEKDVRKQLQDYNYNIEFIHPLDSAHLQFEQQSRNWHMEPSK